MWNRWVWRVLMIPAVFVLLVGLVGLFHPYWFMAFYLQQTADVTLEAFTTAQPQVALLFDIMFRANGLGMAMSGILSAFIIVYGFREGERWSVPALALAGGLGLIGEIILEIVVLRV